MLNDQKKKRQETLKMFKNIGTCQGNSRIRSARNDGRSKILELNRPTAPSTATIKKDVLLCNIFLAVIFLVQRPWLLYRRPPEEKVALSSKGSAAEAAA